LRGRSETDLVVFFTAGAGAEDFSSFKNLEKGCLPELDCSLDTQKIYGTNLKK